MLLHRLELCNILCRHMLRSKEDNKRLVLQQHRRLRRLLRLGILMSIWVGVGIDWIGIGENAMEIVKKHIYKCPEECILAITIFLPF